MEKKKNQAVSPTLEELRQELHQTNQALRNAYDKFNFVTARSWWRPASMRSTP